MRVTMFRKAYSVGGVLLQSEFLTQFYVIAASMFTTTGKEVAGAANAEVMPTTVQNVEFFSAVHAANGVFVIPPTILILICLSLGARYPWRTTGLTVLLLPLLVIQFALAVVGFLGVPAVAGLHGINALILVALGGWLTWRNWAFGQRATAAHLASGSVESP